MHIPTQVRRDLNEDAMHGGDNGVGRDSRARLIGRATTLPFSTVLFNRG